MKLCLSYDFIFRYIDHGNGLICLRILDPFIGDSGEYSCCVVTDHGTCATSTKVTISDAMHEPFRMPVFEKHPVPIAANYGAVVSFCAKVLPLDAQVKWSICGREVAENVRGIMVSVILCE